MRLLMLFVCGFANVMFGMEDTQEQKISLISSDGEVFSVEKSFIGKSTTIKNLLQDDADSPVVLKTIDKQTLELIILMLNASSEFIDKQAAIERLISDNSNLDISKIKKLLFAVDYLESDVLIKTAGALFAKWIMNGKWRVDHHAFNDLSNHIQNIIIDCLLTYAYYIAPNGVEIIKNTFSISTNKHDFKVLIKNIHLLKKNQRNKDFERLVSAIKQKDYCNSKFYLNINPFLAGIKKDTLTPLVLASQFPSSKVALFVVDKLKTTNKLEERLQERDSNNQNILFNVVKSNDKEFINIFINEFKNLNLLRCQLDAKNGSLQETILIHSCGTNVDMLMLVLDAYESVKGLKSALQMSNQENYTPLLKVLAKGTPSMVELIIISSKKYGILEQGLDLPALLLAIKSKNLEKIKLMVKEYEYFELLGNILATLTSDNESVLTAAINTQDKEIFEFFLDKHKETKAFSLFFNDHNFSYLMYIYNRNMKEKFSFIRIFLEKIQDEKTFHEEINQAKKHKTWRDLKKQLNIVAKNDRVKFKPNDYEKNHIIIAMDYKDARLCQIVYNIVGCYGIDKIIELNSITTEQFKNIFIPVLTNVFQQSTIKKMSLSELIQCVIGLYELDNAELLDAAVKQLVSKIKRIQSAESLYEELKKHRIPSQLFPRITRELIANDYLLQNQNQRVVLQAWLIKRIESRSSSYRITRDSLEQRVWEELPFSTKELFHNRVIFE